MSGDKEPKQRIEDPSESRRSFLRRAGQAAGSMAVVALLGEKALVLAGAYAQAEGSGYDVTKHDYLYMIDITKCIGCGSCVRACERENNVPPNYFRTWVERYLISRTGEVLVDSPNGGRDGFEPRITGDDITKGFFAPKICNHCKFTPCVQLCPVGASYRTQDGVVLVDETRCLGCGYCVQACPYGSRFIHPETHVASKCTLCYHRTTKGLLPACVQACPVGARRFGDRKRPGDEVFEIVSSKAVYVLKPELLTEPNCYYVGYSMEVR